MKNIKDTLNESKYGVHRTWDQIEVSLKEALKNCVSNNENDFDYGTGALSSIIRDAVDVKQMKQILDYIVNNYKK